MSAMKSKNIPNLNTGGWMSALPLQRGMAFGLILIAALLAFEMFNYSTTEFALADLLGDLRFMGLRWATILSIAFCGIDFAGIARLFTPEAGEDQPRETWYLFGAWMLAAVMNAMLTWWGISLAILSHQSLGGEVVERATLMRVVPVFVAILIWVTRVMIIGTFAVAGGRIFSMGDGRGYPATQSYNNAYLPRQQQPASQVLRSGAQQAQPRAVSAPQPQQPARLPQQSGRGGSNRAPAPNRTSNRAPASASAFRPVPQPPIEPEYEDLGYLDPSYQPLAMSAAPHNTQQGSRPNGQTPGQGSGGPRNFR